MTHKSIIDSVKDNFAKIKENLSKPTAGGILNKAPTWLHHPSPLLYNLMLDNVADVLDADALWQYGGNVQSQDKPRQAGLRKALQDHPTGIGRKINGNVFNSITYKVFSDVAVWISEELWHEQDLSGNDALFVMADKLLYLHADDFKGLLYQNREPHYSIMPMASLARDQILCQFGLGVFIPGPDDHQTGELRIHTSKKQSHSLPEWWFYEKADEHLPVQKIARPAGFYEKQYSLLIGNGLDNAAIHSPVWFEQEPGGYILVDSRTQPVSFKGDGKIVQTGTCTQNSGISHCPFYAKDNPQDALSLQIGPVGIRTDTLESHTFVDNSNDQPLSGYTFVDSDDEAAAIDLALCLTALALPRTRALPGKSRYWVMSFDSGGFPAATPVETFWQLRGDVNGNLAWRMASEQVWQPTALPLAGTDVPLPIASEMPLHLMPSPLPDSYLALYSLPMPLVLAGLDDGRCTIGRAADIVIDFLTRPDSLSNGTETDTLNNLRFSREHLALEVQGGQLGITQLSATAPTYIQQHGAAFQDLAVNNMAELGPDDRVIVGCYVLNVQSLTTG